MSKTYALRTDLRVLAVQWTGYNQDEFVALFPEGTRMNGDSEVINIFPPSGGRLRLEADQYLVQNGAMYDVWPAHCFRSVFVEM